MTARDLLIQIRLDYLNGYLTPAVYAEVNGLTENEGRELLLLAAKVASHDHPEA